MGLTLTLAEAASIIASAIDKTKDDGGLIGTVSDKRKRSVLLTNGSITTLLANIIISPVIRVSSNLKGLPITEKVVEANMDYFAAFYSLSFKYLVENAGFDVTETMQLLGSTRPKLGILEEGVNAIAESRKEDPKFLPIESVSYEMKGESKDDNKSLKSIFIREINIKLKAKNKVGENSTYVIPMIIRAIVSYVNPGSLERAVKATNKADKSFFANWHAYRAGEKSLSDLIFGTSLIKEEKRARLEDERDGILSSIAARENDANAKALTTGAVGFGKYYMMLIIDKDTKVRLENAIKAKISSNSGKEQLLESLKAMSVTVVDTDYEMVITYFNDLPGSSEYTFKALERRDKNNDLTDIMKILASRI